MADHPSSDGDEVIAHETLPERRY